MKYFKSLITEIEGEKISFLVPDNTEGHVFYDRIGNIEYHGLPDTIDPERILMIQHTECEVEEVSFDDIQDVLINCRLYNEINNQIENRIRQEYSVGKEFAMIKLPHDDGEYISYINFVEQSREDGRVQKVALGLKQ